MKWYVCTLPIKFPKKNTNVTRNIFSETYTYILNEVLSTSKTGTLQSLRKIALK